MTELKLWYLKLNTVKKNEFRDNVMNNECGINVSVSSFFNYMEAQQAPEPLQKEIAELTGIAKEDLYKGA